MTPETADFSDKLMRQNKDLKRDYGSIWCNHASRPRRRAGLDIGTEFILVRAAIGTTPVGGDFSEGCSRRDVQSRQALHFFVNEIAAAADEAACAVDRQAHVRQMIFADEFASRCFQIVYALVIV